MKQFALLMFCIVLAIANSGCRSSTGNDVEVIVDGDGQFPDFLVGTWKAEKGGWEFTFEPDGKISSAIVSIGRVHLKPGQTTTVLNEGGGKGVFEPGQWTVQYLQKQRELIVEIFISYFRTEHNTEQGIEVVRGQTRDFFVGSVSTDGKSWWTDRFTFPEYIADSNIYHNYKLPFDPKDNPRESLLFRKVPESN